MHIQSWQSSTRHGRQLIFWPSHTERVRSCTTHRIQETALVRTFLSKEGVPVLTAKGAAHADIQAEHTIGGATTRQNIPSLRLRAHPPKTQATPVDILGGKTGTSSAPSTGRPRPLCLWSCFHLAKPDTVARRQTAYVQQRADAIPVRRPRNCRPTAHSLLCSMGSSGRTRRND